MKRDKNLDFSIAAHVSDHPGAERKDIAAKLKRVESTLNPHISRLIDEGQLREGLTVTDAWKKQQIKSYIFIETVYRDAGTVQRSEFNYQQELVQNIKDRLGAAPYRGVLFLDSIEIVMGADFDIILILLAKDVSPLGSLVTGFLRTQPYVNKTRTVLAWPSSTPLPNPPQDDGDSAAV